MDTGEVEFDVSDKTPKEKSISITEEILSVLKEHGKTLEQIQADISLLRNDQLVIGQECALINKLLSQLDCKQPRRPASSELCKVVGGDHD